MITEKKQKKTDYQVKEKENLFTRISFFNDSHFKNKKSIKDLRGKIKFRDDYDYKSMR